MVRLLVFERKERSVTGNWAVVERFLFCQLFHDLLVELFELDMVFLRDAGFAAIETQRAGGDELVRVAVERAQVDAEHAGECGTRGAQAQRERAAAVLIEVDHERFLFGYEHLARAGFQIEVELLGQRAYDDVGQYHVVQHGGEKRRDRDLEHAAVCFGADRCAKARVAGKGLGQAVHRKAVVFVERECRAVERVDNDVRNAVDQNVDRADLIAHLVEKTPVRDLLGAQAGYAERAAVGERFVR